MGFTRIIHKSELIISVEVDLMEYITAIKFNIEFRGGGYSTSVLSNFVVN